VPLYVIRPVRRVGLLGQRVNPWATSSRPVSCYAGLAQWAEIAAQHYPDIMLMPTQDRRHRVGLVLVWGQNFVLWASPWALCQMAIYSVGQRWCVCAGGGLEPPCPTSCVLAADPTRLSRHHCTRFVVCH
jgi:hypothetical protein